MRQQVLIPLGMRQSTFLRAEVPAELAASPHVGMPLSVPTGAYPYTRSHAPSSSACTPTWSSCAAGWWPTASRSRVTPPGSGHGWTPTCAT